MKTSFEEYRAMIQDTQSWMIKAKLLEEASSAPYISGVQAYELEKLLRQCREED